MECSKCGTQALEEAVFCSSCGAAVASTASPSVAKAVPQSPAAANKVATTKINSLDKKLHITLTCAAGIAVILLYTTELIGLIGLATGITFGLSLRLFFSHQKNNFIGTKKIDWVLLGIASTIAFILMFTEDYNIQALFLIFVAV
jgi:hypothetical protein